MAVLRYQPAKVISLYSAFLISFLFFVTIAHAAQVTIVLDSVTSEAEGLRIFQRRTGENYNYQQPVWTGMATSCTIDNLVAGETYFFVARSFAGSQESADSNEVQYTVEWNDVPTPGVNIIDDGQPGATATGRWKISGGANPYGAQSLYSKHPGASYDFKLAADMPGRYEVAIWWTFYSNRCSVVPVQIYDGDVLVDTVTVNQQYNGGQWNTLGSYNFTDQAKAVVVAESDECSTCADAVKFTLLDFDSDLDGVRDPDDAFPFDEKEWRDADSDGIGDNADTDDDNDGMPDEWEIFYGLDPLEQDAWEDQDGDGIANIDEYNNGTDPNGLNGDETIIIDDGQPGASSIGTWKISGGVNPYGSQSLYSKEVGAEYTFESMITGRYEVALWWTHYSNRCTAVPVEIYDGDLLLETITVNQLHDSGQWNVLGTYDFNKYAKVVVVSEDNDCSTSADAAKFTVVENGGPIIIDDSDAGAGSSGYWKVSSGAEPYGVRSLYSREASATYRYEAPLTGRFEVALWWTYYSNRCSNVPVKIYDGDVLLSALSVDQLQNGGQWVVIGGFDFTVSAKVVITAQGTGCSTSADAVSFIPVE
jgi:hypothetical protein